MNIYVWRDGEIYGPYSKDDVRAYMQHGAILREDLAGYEGDAAWQPLAQLLMAKPKQYRLQTDRQMASGDWHDQPATAKQMARLRFIGIEFPIVITKGHAGSIIDRTGGDPAYQEKLERWQKEKYRLHPDIYPPELKWSLESGAWLARFRPPSLYRFDFKRPQWGEIIAVLRALDERDPAWREGGPHLSEYIFMHELAHLFPDLRKRACSFPIPGFRAAPVLQPA